MTTEQPDKHTLAQRRSTLRNEARMARNAVVGTQREIATVSVQQKMEALLTELATPPGCIALSLPTDGEIDLASIAPTLRSAGWTLTLPVVHSAGEMTFRKWDVDSQLTTNKFGIAEPVDGPDLLPDVVVVPCVALDRSGNRLGFGKGYYDTALKRAGFPFAIGAVFDEQLTDRVPAEQWDVALDAVVAPSGVWRPGRQG